MRSVHNPSVNSRFSLLSLCLLPGILLLLLPVASDASCVPKQPVEMLRCLEELYSARDVEGWAALLADDFIFEYGDMSSWTKEDEVRSTTRMFESPDVLSIRLTFDGPEQVLDGPETDSWILEGVSTQLVVDAVKDGKTETYTVEGEGHSFWIRRSAGSFQIFRWRQPGQ